MKGKELLRLMTEAGLSRRRLAAELGIADSTVGRWIKEDASGKGTGKPLGRLEAAGIVHYFEKKHGLSSKWEPFK